MTIINCTLPYGVIRNINDYSKIINEILRYDITFNILKFSTGTSGVNILLDVPENKIKEITETLKQNEVIVNKKGRIIIDDELCVDCGGCISLCPTDALHFNDQYQLEFDYEKCIGCLLCLDSCPRYAIEEM
ncbi:MAG: 4Fe-4S dicluster domain-containing protein [Candidatus Lokiarchaeota archaeon]|nr:4Fe-4S dicluster domain-containing protein [Candidatus Lokiarchaeota archaeon]